jgi:hypothetical protein
MKVEMSGRELPTEVMFQLHSEHSVTKRQQHGYKNRLELLKDSMNVILKR